MKIAGLILCLLITLTTGAPKIAAQETSKPAAALPEYVVEVRRSDGCIVSPVSTKHQSGSVLYALPRDPGMPTTIAGHPITSNVLVSAKQQGEQWEVKVSIGTGEFFDAGDIRAGDFKLNLNQRVDVNEFSRYGLSPIRVGVVKIIRQQAGKPRFANLTQSLSLESFEANALPDPYKLQVRNDSRSDLIAIQFNTLGREQFLHLKWLSQGLVHPLIKAGKSHRLEVNSEDKSCGDAEGYHPNQSNRIELVSAVFADGTYEGQPGLAALVKGGALGNRRNLERVVETLRNSSADPGEYESHLNYLKGVINEEIEPGLVETLRSLVPSLKTDADTVPTLTGFIRLGMHEVKVNVINDAQHLESLNRKDNPKSSKEFVERVKTKYEYWLKVAANITAQ